MYTIEYSPETLYLDHQHWLRVLLYRRLKCRDTAEDLTQDVFVRILGKSTPPAIREPRAYLAQIAHGLLVDHRRRLAIERAWLSTLATLAEVEVPSAEEQILMLDMLTRIDALLDGLKPRVRQVFLASRLEEKPYVLIARDLGVSLSTVEKDMALALRHCYCILLGG